MLQTQSAIRDFTVYFLDVATANGAHHIVGRVVAGKIALPPLATEDAVTSALIAGGLVPANTCKLAAYHDDGMIAVDVAGSGRPLFSLEAA